MFKLQILILRFQSDSPNLINSLLTSTSKFIEIDRRLHDMNNIHNIIHITMYKLSKKYYINL